MSVAISFYSELYASRTFIYGYIYATEGDCEFARYELQEGFKQKSDSYKENTKMESYCLEFESFPISGLNKINLGV